MIAVIVPCYNEFKRLNHLAFKEFSEQNPHMHFYFASDGSTDDTCNIITEKLLNNKTRFLIDYKINRGKAETVRDSIYKIYNDSVSYDYFAFIDADLAIPLEQINKIKGQADLCMDKSVFITVRTKKEFQQSKSKLRYYISVIWKFFFIKMFFGLNISDTQCGCKMFKKEIIENTFKDNFISRWLFDIEIIFRAFKKQNNCLVEVPIIKLNDNSDSSINNRAILLLLKDVFKIYAKYKIK
jgi:hypothetical protein